MKCVVPDVLRGVTMHHSDDLVTVHYGAADGPLTACGFHWTYYAQECREAAREALESV